MLEIFFAAAQCSHVAVPEATEQAMRYYNSGNILWMVQQAWALIIPLLFLVKGFTGKLEHFSKKIGKNWFFTIAVYLILFIAIYQLLFLPFDFYAGFIRQHEFGLSTQTFERWVSNYGKEALVLMISSVLFVWIFYLLLKKSPRRWWLYSALVTIGIQFITTFIQPIWIDPLFNKFGPMKNQALEGQILSLAARAGIANGRVYEVDKSQDTNAINAYVTGIGSSTRIVLWDTTIKKMPTDQILFTMGHEMGHYVLHHVRWQMLYLSVLSFAIFYITYRAANFLMHRYHKRFGFNHLYHIASLPLLLFLINLLLLISTPLSNYISRYMEHEADRFGLEITQNNEAAAKAFITLQMQNLANPRPGAIYKFWRNTHPSLGDRIDFCNSYCPWNQEQPLKYGKYFKAEPH